jgi:uncharacterized membrane protein YidH (DUF202 family)
MNTRNDPDYRFSAATEVLVIGMIKITLALFIFSFSTLAVETVKLFIMKADTWMTDSSRQVSKNIIDLYK